MLITCIAKKDNTVVYKVRTSGEDKEQIVAVSQPVMQVVGEYIYYTPQTYAATEEITDEYTHLYRCKLDGSETKEIINKPTYCWFIFDNYVLYQDDRDNSSLHLFDIENEEDVKLNDQISYCPIFDGEYIYYVSEKELNDEADSTVWRMNIDGSDNQELADYKINSRILLVGDTIYFIYADDDFRLYSIDTDGNNLTQISQDGYIRNMSIYGSELSYAVCAKDYKYIDHIVLCDLDGSNVQKWKFGK